VCADEVGVADPAVVDGFSGLHRSLQLLDHIAFLNQVVLDGDAGDLAKGLGQRLGFVLVCRDGLRHDRDFVDTARFELGCGIGKPLELGGLLLLA
jgi:hypothetical protein